MVDVTNKPSPTTVRQTGPQPQPDPRSQPGTDLYDWYTINDALRNAGLEGWQIAGGSHQPVNQGTWAKNPSYDSTLTAQENIDAGNGDEYTYRAGPDYVIGVVNPTTHQMLKLTLGRQGDPKTGYSYTITGRQDQGKIDQTQGGYTGIQRLPFADGHEELWGTNSTTGAFEKMPQPAGLGTKPTGWNDIKQIDDGQGHLVWVGTDPSGKPMQPIPGQPQINTAKYVPGSVKQVTKNGRQVYVGQNAQTQQFEDIPELGSENAPVKTTTVGGQIYKDNPNAGQPGEPDFVKVSGIASPNNGDKQWADAGGGYVKRQVYNNGAWGDVGPDDPEGTWRPVNPATVASEAATTRATAALKPAGTKYWTPLTGSPDTLIEVTADGNGSYTYETGPNGEAPRTMKIPGIAQPTTVTGGAATDEFLPSRRDPITQQLLPPEKNPNWQPSNIGDRVRQLQDTARAKQQELHTQVTSGAITEDQANQQFNDWWDSSIEPAKQEIQQAQQQKQTDEQIKVSTEQRAQQEQQRSNYSTALQAGTNAVEAYKAELPNMVGPNFGNAFNQLANAWATGGKVPSNIDWGSALTYQMPDLNQLSQQVTNQALAHLSPTAAQNMNDTHGVQAAPGTLQQLPNYDYTQSLQQNKYQPATTTIAPDGTVTINHTQPTTQAPPAPPAAPTPAAYTPPGYGAGTAPTYPTVPWAGATPQPLSDPIATLQSLPNYQLTPS